MARCPNCGTHLSPDFLRVFGDNDSEIEYCPECCPDSRVDERQIAGLDPVTEVSDSK